MRYPSSPFALRKARSTLGLAFLTSLAITLLIAFSTRDDPTLAFSSPNSPLSIPRGTVSAQSPLPIHVQAIEPDIENTPTRPVWQPVLGVGMIAIGLAFVVGGSISLMRR